MAKRFIRFEFLLVYPVYWRWECVALFTIFGFWISRETFCGKIELNWRLKGRLLCVFSRFGKWLQCWICWIWVGTFLADANFSYRQNSKFAFNLVLTLSVWLSNPIFWRCDFYVRCEFNFIPHWGKFRW